MEKLRMHHDITMRRCSFSNAPLQTWQLKSTCFASCRLRYGTVISADDVVVSQCGGLQQRIHRLQGARGAFLKIEVNHEDEL